MLCPDCTWLLPLGVGGAVVSPLTRRLSPATSPVICPWAGPSLPWTSAVGSLLTTAQAQPLNLDSIPSAHAPGHSSEQGLEQDRGCPGFSPGESSSASQAFPFGSWLQTQKPTSFHPRSISTDFTGGGGAFSLAGGDAQPHSLLCIL